MAKVREPGNSSGKSRASGKSDKSRASGVPKGRPAPAPVVSTGFWLLKSEPDVFSWRDLVACGEAGEPWTGVRNYQARNNMRAMQLGDRAFFYHSNEGKEIVGICRIMALAHADPEDDTGTWECVDVAAERAMPRPVTLEAVKAEPRLAGMSLVASFRLSVQPVRPEEWQIVCQMGGIAPSAGNWDRERR